MARYDVLFGDVKATVSRSIAELEEEVARNSKELQWRVFDCEKLLKSRVNETYVKDYTASI